MPDDSGVQILAGAETISSPKHPDQFQRPPTLQLNENHSFSLAIKLPGQTV